MPSSSGQRPRDEISCPTCGAPAERGQLVCLECGSRIALGYRRPPRWQVAAGVVVGVVVIAVVALLVALRDVTDDAEREVAQTTPAETAPAGAKDGTAKAKAEPKTKAKAKRRKRPATRRKAATTPTAPVSGGVATWPKATNAFTVVLVSSEDKASATSVAKAARKAKVRAGVMRSDDYDSLSKGFYIVFVGVYKTRPQAERAADRYGKAYKGAFPQYVDGKDSGK